MWDKRKAEIVGMKRAFQGDEFLQLMRMTQAHFNGAFDVTDSCFAAMVIEGG